MSLRDAYKEQIQAQFQEHKAKLDLLRARAKRAAARGKILAYEELGDADKHLADAKAKLKIFADAGGSALAELKSGVNRAFSDLKTASQRAADHLRANAATPVPVKPVAAKPVAAKPVAAKPVAAKPVAAKPATAKTAKTRPSARTRRGAPAKGH